MDEEIENSGEKSRPTSPHHGSEAGPSRSSSMHLSQDELDDLFAPYE